MRVDVDEPGRDDLAGRIELPAAGKGRPDLGDDPAS